MTKPPQFKRGQPIRARRSSAEKYLPGWYLTQLDAKTHSVFFDGGSATEIHDDNIQAVPDDLVITGKFCAFVKANGEITLSPYRDDPAMMQSWRNFPDYKLAAIVDLSGAGLRFAEGQGLLPQRYQAGAK